MLDFRLPADGSPVVALETAVLTHGLPRPQNLEAVRAMAAAVEAAGAVPAVVAVLDGRLVVGCTAKELERLAGDGGARKAGARELGPVMAAGASAGTTVSGTLAACRLAGIRVFATGGIGGVHRGWSQHRDVSADLGELARTPCCVVSSGAKSVLDLPATLETLETLGVPVLGHGTDCFPRFHTRGDGSLPIEGATVEQAARVCRLRWESLGQAGGVLLANPVPAPAALEAARVEAVVEGAVAEAEARGVRGQAVTPFLLAALAEATAGDSLACNLALLEDNAAVAGRLAVALARPS
jgi:pseudouridine-5'-phosphate glycosidase